MRIVLLGVGGFIGRHILSDLLANGHDVIGVVRQIGGLAEAFPDARFVARDLARATSPDAWAPLLGGVDIVVNAAGVLSGRDMRAVHVTMPEALHAAALRAGVRRVVLVSAISARPDVKTNYATSKLAGEAALVGSGLDWTILRPSLVYGDGSYGGTSLLRGLAGLPWRVPLPGKGDFPFTPLHARDLARTVRIVCENGAYAGQVLEPVGPETLSLKDLLGRYRAWLGFGKARFLPVPMPLMRLIGRTGDALGHGPVATNSLVQMIAGNAGDSARFAAAIGFSPRALDEALRARPAQVQDRWHARLFFLAPALKAVLAAMWIASAFLGLLYGAPRTEYVVQGLGLPASWADPMRIGSSMLDLAVAALVIMDRSARWATIAQLVVVLGFTATIGWAVPALWLDPLGSLLKNVPILLAILVHGIVGDRR